MTTDLATAPRTLIAPSVLSCDLVRLADQVRAVEEAGADWLHVDIMDGHFVPALTFGPKIVETLRRITNMPLDVHLMVEKPDDWVDSFISAGATSVSFHIEAVRHPRRLLRHIRSLGGRAGLALNPATLPDGLRYLAADLDLVVVMSVDPGFAGQPFLEETFSKLADVARVLRAVRAGTAAGSGEGPMIEVDGGVHPGNAGALAAAGAGVLVAGHSVFGQPDPAVAVHALARAVRF